MPRVGLYWWYKSSNNHVQSHCHFLLPFSLNFQAYVQKGLTVEIWVI